MVRPIRRAARAEAAPLTVTVTNLLAPSPSRTICCARSIVTASSAFSKSRRLRRSAGGALPAAPVAHSSTVSEVEVSPSTVTALNERSFDRASSFCSSGAGMLASVKTKPSIVAMSGAIMPLPLAKPAMRTVVTSIRASAPAPLGKVSVVMMASAASRQASSRRWRDSSGRQPPIWSGPSGTPITPVEARNTSSSAQSSRAAAADTVWATAVSPALPVKALALPELHTIARARPPGSASLHQSTGAEEHSERVKTPATAVPGARTASIRSFAPLRLRPQARPANCTPPIAGRSGNRSGASGDFFKAIMRTAVRLRLRAPRKGAGSGRTETPVP